MCSQGSHCICVGAGLVSSTPFHPQHHVVVLLDVVGWFWMLLDVAGWFWMLLDVVGLLLGVVGCCWIVVGCCWMLLGVAGCCWMLLDVVGQQYIPSTLWCSQCSGFGSTQCRILVVLSFCNNGGGGGGGGKQRRQQQQQQPSTTQQNYLGTKNGLCCASYLGTDLKPLLAMHPGAPSSDLSWLIWLLLLSLDLLNVATINRTTKLSGDKEWFVLCKLPFLN